MQEMLKKYRRQLIEIEEKVNIANEGTYYKSPEFAHASYSKYGEDMLIIRAFDRMGIRKPTYMDIGAYHPFYLSNTAVMHQMGGKGINIEPNPELSKLFVKYRPNDINLSCAIGRIKGMKPFQMPDINNNGESTSKNSILFNTKNVIYKTYNIDVDVITINDVVKINGNTMPQYMSINIGGIERGIIESYDFNNDDPTKIPIIITMAVHDKAIVEYFSKCGYCLWLKVFNSFTFIQNKYI